MAARSVTDANELSTSDRAGDDQRPPDGEAWQNGGRNVEWADAHREELERKYPGYWLCIAEERLVVAEQDPERFSALTRAGNYHGPGRGPYIFCVPTKEDVAAVHSHLHAPVIIWHD
jgi:hypothetical protein